MAGQAQRRPHPLAAPKPPSQGSTLSSAAWDLGLCLREGSADAAAHRARTGNAQGPGSSERGPASLLAALSSKA